jgi:peptidyl-prolyl cis-trans isomerase A (cyclophilin A)
MSRAAPALVLVLWLSSTVVAMLYQPGQSAGPPSLLNPASVSETAPGNFRALFDTTVGMFVIQVHRDWAPNGADRFYTLVKHGFYDNCRFFRVVPKFMAQFGIHGDPAIAEVWRDATIPADRALKSNIRGRVTFAMSSEPTSRSTQVFINYGDNSRLDIDGFAPFGEVTSSMVLVELIFSGYGESPDQGRIQTEGNGFLIKYFPRLDFIRKATITE